MLKFLKNIFNSFLLMRYRSTGLILGEMLSYGYMGKACSYDETKQKFLNLEEKVSKQGLIPLKIEDLIRTAGWERPLPDIKKGSVEEILEVKTENLESISSYESQFSMDLANKL